MKKLITGLMAGAIVVPAVASAADFDVTANVNQKCTLEVRDSFLGEIITTDGDQYATSANVGVVCAATAFLSDVHIGLSNTNSTLGEATFTNGTDSFKATMYKPNAIGNLAPAAPVVAPFGTTNTCAATHTTDGWGPTGTDRVTATVTTAALGATSYIPICFYVTAAEALAADVDSDGKVDADAVNSYTTADTSANNTGKYKADITATLEF